MNLTTNPTNRVSLAPGGTSPGPLDGGWWPHSRDLIRELPPLVTAFEDLRGRITRAAVHPAFRPVIPRKIQVAGLVLRVGWFTRLQDPHALLLLSRRVTTLWDLLVIPPDTPAATAARLMASDCDPQNVLTASGLMAGAAAEANREAQETDWEAEGGRVHTVHGDPRRGR